MAPPRRVDSDLGDALRTARQALKLDQVGLARKIPVSARQVSRWENGGRPTERQTQRLAIVFSGVPANILRDLYDALGLDLPEAEDTAAPPPPVPSPPAAPPAPVAARPSAADLRASFDAIIYAAAESRDLLPRHLRAFAVELFQGAARLGVEPKEAALLVAAAAAERVTVAKEP